MNNLTESQQEYLSALLQQRKVLFKDNAIEGNMIQSILDNLGDELIVVVYGEDGVAGDSIWGPETWVPYTPNMTKSQLKMAFARMEWKDCGFEDQLINERSVDKLMDSEGFDGFKGGWVIRKSEYDKIMDAASDMSFGNDTAVYASVRSIKTMIKNSAEKVI